MSEALTPGYPHGHARDLESGRRFYIDGKYRLIGYMQCTPTYIYIHIYALPIAASRRFGRDNLDVIILDED